MAWRVWAKDARRHEKNTKLELLVTINEIVKPMVKKPLESINIYICWHKHSLWYGYKVSNMVAATNCNMGISTWQSIPHIYVKVGERERERESGVRWGAKTGYVAWKSPKDLKKVELCFPSHLMTRKEICQC